MILTSFSWEISFIWICLHWIIPNFVILSEKIPNMPELGLQKGKIIQSTVLHEYKFLPILKYLVQYVHKLSENSYFSFAWILYDKIFWT